MKSILYISIGCFVMLNIISCSQGSENEIEAELQVYFSSFVEEASTYGMDISLEDIDLGGYIENIEARGTLGQCKSYSNGSKQVVIDEPYWDRVDDLEREYLVFHELGHCLLGRDHDDTKDEDGNCASIMQSGEGGCKSVYNLENRERLLEELFE